jgi:tRNA A-37 threonylcarbamoyl transferase component Bud32
VIFNSPHYNILRLHIQNVKDLLTDFINLELPSNESHNENILTNILYDVLYSYISRNYNETEYINKNNEIEYDNILEINDNLKLLQILNSIEIVIKCSKKGINTPIVSKILINNIINTIRLFKKYHNKIDEKYNEKIKAFNYGSSAHTYILENHQIVLKTYNNDLRWKTIEHDNVDEIYNKELSIIKITDNLVSSNDNEKILYLKYLGNSLYDSFDLPSDWKIQISSIFSELTFKNIYYPEFNIKNILNKENKLYFIDFGLASIVDNKNNSHNCENFIDLLEILKNRFEKSKHHYEKLTLYNTFINNIKIHKIEKYLNNVF